MKLLDKLDFIKDRIEDVSNIYLKSFLMILMIFAYLFIVGILAIILYKLMNFPLIFLSLGLLGFYIYFVIHYRTEVKK